MARVRVPGVLQRFCITYFVVAGTAAVVAHYTKDGFKEEQANNNQVDTMDNDDKKVGIIYGPNM